MDGWGRGGRGVGGGRRTESGEGGGKEMDFIS